MNNLDDVLLVLHAAFGNQDLMDHLGVTFDDVTTLITAEVVQNIQYDRIINRPKVEEVKKQIKRMFPTAIVSGRIKSLISILGKFLLSRNTADVFAFKVLVSTPKDCYQVLRKLKKEFRVYDIDDKIKHPKKSGYRDIQIFMAIPQKDGTDLSVEVQIQTFEMYADSQEDYNQLHAVVYPWKNSKAIQDFDARFPEYAMKVLK